MKKERRECDDHEEEEHEMYPGNQPKTKKLFSWGPFPVTILPFLQKARMGREGRRGEGMGLTRHGRMLGW